MCGDSKWAVVDSKIMATIILQIVLKSFHVGFKCLSNFTFHFFNFQWLVLILKPDIYPPHSYLGDKGFHVVLLESEAIPSAILEYLLISQICITAPITVFSLNGDSVYHLTLNAPLQTIKQLETLICHDSCTF